MITTPDFQKLEGIVEWMKAAPFEVNRHELYHADELYNGYEPSPDADGDRAWFDCCYDSQVYQHFIHQGKHADNVYESLARTIHDHGMYLALRRHIDKHNPRRCIGIMGGHALPRTNPLFANIVMLSKRLTEKGFHMVSGGGPGAMEATHLGAWMAGRTAKEAANAMELLATTAPTFHDEKWLSSALEVRHRYPQERYESLGIPTWLYGHEPSTPFATHIAKFFTNSLREDVILTIAFGGIIFTPGSAGTLQEIFQEAVQNHYLSFGMASPMIFLGKKFWTEELPAYRLIEHLVKTGRYKNMLLTLTDDTSEIESMLEDFQKTMQESAHDLHSQQSETPPAKET